MEHSVGISRLAVRRRPGHARQGVLVAGGRAIPVALGRSGVSPDKREGDGRTPAGRWRILAVLYRPDAGPRPATRLPCRPIAPADGWCDAPRHRLYNRQVRLPFPASHERLWREDGLYDLLLVLDHNTRPRVAGRGSAVFVHVARPGLRPTEGCVALPRAELRRLLARLRPGARLVIAA
ncbi:L,D-transpeptidase family protein [Xanthobacter sp. V4C-4]|uniref:L,D-transpeptidase family protein n=1 Tax=Xanthobacter cornucopiae TaxID=3119924 RepID=UPI00372714D6